MLIYSFSVFGTLVLLAFLLFGILDYWLRMDGVGPRWLLSSGWILVVLTGFARIVWPAIRFRRPILDVAKAVECNHPEFRTNLSLAADFLCHPTATGSKELKQRLIESATDSLKELDPLRELSRRGPVRAAMLLAVVVLVVGGIVVSHPSDSLLALSRLANPTHDRSWPARNQLEFVDLPSEVPTGSPLKFAVVDRGGNLPKRVFIEIARGDDLLRREMTRNSDRMVFRLPQIHGTLRVRAVGGDDQTDWFSVSAIQPPSVVALEIEVQPPKYSGLPRTVVAPFQKIWAGSQIRILGATDQAFSAGRIVFLPREISQSFQPVNQKHFQFPQTGSLPIDSDTEFRAELISEDGLVGGLNRTYRIPARTDEPPFAELEWINPQTLVSVRDPIRIRVHASDDMQLAGVDLRVLHNGQILHEVSHPVKDRAPLLPTSTDRSQQTWNHTFHLEQIVGAKPVLTVEILAEAKDIKGQSTKSGPLTIRIGKPDELTSFGRQQRQQIRGLLTEIAELQGRAFRSTRKLLEQADEIDRGSRSSIVRRIADQQQQVETKLFGTAGITELCTNYLATETGKRSERENPEVRPLLDQVHKLRDPARTAIRLILDYAEAHESDGADASMDKGRLQRIAQQQQIILTTLGGLADAIGAESRYRQSLNEIREILEIETRLETSCIGLQKQMVRNPQRDPDPELERLAVEQQGVVTRLTELAWQLNEDADKTDSQPLEGLAEEIRLAVIDARQARTQLRDRKPGLAIQTIHTVIERLAPLLAESMTSAFPANHRGIEGLEAAAKSLNPLVESANQLADQTGNWNGLDPQDRQKLLQEIASLKKELTDFLEEHGTALTEHSRTAMNESRNLLDQTEKNLGQNRTAEAIAGIQQAAAELQKTRNSLAARIQELKRLERNERFRRLQTEFIRWLESANAILEKLEQLRSNETAGQPDTLEPLQRVLSTEIEAVLLKNRDLFALEVELKKIHGLSIRTQQQLQANDIVESIRSEQDLIRHLKELADQRFENDPPENGNRENENNQSSKDESDSGTVTITEFEIQLIRRMQEEILKETDRLDNLLKQDLPPRQRDSVNRSILELADREAELISLIEKYLAANPTGKSPNDGKGKNSEKENGPDIPDIPDIPEIPELQDDDCFGVLDGSPEPINAATPIRKTPQEDQDPAKPKPDKQGTEKQKIEAVNPFIPQGEDIGEDSDPIRNRLESIRQKMATVQELLIQKKTSSRNRELQTKIIEELKLFSTDKQKQSKKPKNGNQKENPAKKGDTAATGSNSTKQADPDKATESQADDPQIRDRIDQIWGHLPERLRDSELSIRADRFLPKYRDLLKEYFKSLAKEPPIR